MQKSIKSLQETMLYKNMASIILLKNYLTYKFRLTFEKANDVDIAVLNRVPIPGNEENGDDPVMQHKRRYENKHTIKTQLKKIWNIDIGVQQGKEYEKLCDIIESVIYKAEFIKDTEIKEKVKFGARIRLFALFKDHKTKPLDLFDRPLDDDIFGNTYRNVIKEFIQEIESAAGVRHSIRYSSLRIFWKKWYREFVDDIYLVACKDCLPETVKSFYSIIYEPVTENLIKKNFGGDLFSEILFNLLKEEMENDLYRFKYIIKHSKVVMNSLNTELQPLFNELNDITRDDSYTYIDIEILVQQHDRVVQTLLGDTVDVSKVFLQAKKLMETIVFPRETHIFFYHFFTLMQCCSGSYESELKIEHYGMPRGNKKVKLKTVIRRPDDNNCKEVRLFLMYMMRRRYFMNCFDEKITDQIDYYRLSWEENISNCIRCMGKWNEIEADLNELQYIYLQTKQL